MSHPSSSIVSVDNAEIKYKKALKEISKLMAANRALRDNPDKNNTGLKDRMQQLSLRYEDLEKQYQATRKQKESLSHYLDQLQKQRNNLDRQVAYLNQVLHQQGATLRKYQLQNDQRAIATLIRTYQQKQTLMTRNIAQQEDIIARLKNHSEKQDNQISLLEEEKRNLDDKYNRASMEINRYRELNSTLMQQNQRILMEHSYKQDNLTEKEKQLQILAKQFRMQIGLLKMKDEEDDNSSHGENKIKENLEQILGEKNRISLQYTKLRQSYQELLQRQSEYYEMQQKLKIANLKAERALQEVNMLKSKIVVLEAKQFLEEAGEDDYDQKQFEQRLAILISQNDPINVLRNGDDSSHFKIMKSFLVDLQDKIYKINLQKANTSKKYKSIKTKFVKNVKELHYYEDQNKLLKGKIQGYQRLTEKLQFQLERALSTHDEEITRMSLTSNHILTKKTEDFKATISLLNSQIEIGQEKLEKVQKNLKQENDTLKLELQTLRIKFKEFTQKSGKDGQFIEIYKKKNQELSTKIRQIEDENSELNESSTRWERLFREQKTKGEGLIAQKQQLSTQNRQLFDEIDRKTNSFNQSLKSKQNYAEGQIKRLKNEIAHLKDENQYMNRQLQKLQRDLQDRRAIEQSEIDEIKRQSNRNIQLEEKRNQYKKRIRQLQDQNETLKLKGKKYLDNYEKSTRIEQQILQKNDTINDLVRSKLTLENDLKNVKSQLEDEKKQNEGMKKQISQFRLKSMDSSHETRRQFDNKILQNKKIIQSLNQQVSDLSSELRQQKSKIMRLNNQIANLRSQKNRIQQTIQQNSKKDFNLQSQIGTLKLEVSKHTNQNEKLINQLKSKQFTENKLNQEIQALQQKIFGLNQQVSNLKMKIQTLEDSNNDLVRDLNSLKFNFSGVQTHIKKIKGQANLKWEQETFLSSCTEILNKIRKIGRYFGVVYEITPSVPPIATTTTQVTTRTAAGGGNQAYDYFKSYSRDNSVNASQKSFRPLESNFQSSQSFKMDYNSNAGGRNANQDFMNPTYNFSEYRQKNMNTSEVI